MRLRVHVRNRYLNRLRGEFMSFLEVKRKPMSTAEKAETLKTAGREFVDKLGRQFDVTTDEGIKKRDKCIEAVDLLVDSVEGLMHIPHAMDKIESLWDYSSKDRDILRESGQIISKAEQYQSKVAKDAIQTSCGFDYTLPVDKWNEIKRKVKEEHGIKKELLPPFGF